MDLIVLSKEPRPGRVKTRLCPPCSAQEAAAIATAALADTLDAALASRADRIVLALDGRPGPWCPRGVDVVDQGGGGLDRRLGRAWSHARGPALQIDMDKPHVTATALDRAMATLELEGVDAVLGHATDGGWWAAGMRGPLPDAFHGVPTSRADTGRRQEDRLRRLGLGVARFDRVADVDAWPDAVAVAAAAPATRFAATVHPVVEDRRLAAVVAP